MTSHLLLDSDAYYEYLSGCARRSPKAVALATFGLYAGILTDGRDTRDWGPRYKSRTRDIMELMRSVPDVRILIGLYPYRSCKGKQVCHNCESQFVRQFLRLLEHADHFPTFNWRVNLESHIKCVLFTYAQSLDSSAELAGVAGGRNFTDSNWADVSFTLEPQAIQQLSSHYDELWEAAWPLTNAAADEFIRQEGISEKGVQTVLGATE